MALPPALMATTKSPRTATPLDELLDELEEDEEELLELEELELLELEELEELLELLELEELELLLELLLSPPQPANQMLVAISARDKTRLFADDLIILLITHLFIGVSSVITYGAISPK
jgi:hypothetical protein